MSALGRSEQMSKTYAIADLHGRFDLLEMALARITERAELPATLITLGDYVDRGPDSRQIIEHLMAGLERDGWRLICLKPRKTYGDWCDGPRPKYGRCCHNRVKREGGGD